MLKNYLQTALRSLGRKKGYSAINVVGLAVGLASCLVIFQYVTFEYSFDRFHENRETLYRIRQSIPLIGDASSPDAFTPYGLGPAVEEAIPEAVHISRAHPEYEPALITTEAHPDLVLEEDRILYADSSFLNMFSFMLLRGNRAEAMKPGNVLITERAGRRFFGDEDPLGQIMNITGNVQGSYRVVGLLEDVPPNSHLQFDLLLPIEDLLRDVYGDEPEHGWSWNNFSTYLQLRPGSDHDATARKIEDVYRTHHGEALREQGRFVEMRLQPLEDVHLNAEVTGSVGVIGNYRTVYFFMVIGLVVLLIALINYVNLATARSLDRAREVGVRKAVGAHRRQLMVQFLCESGLTNLMAAVLAVMIARAVMPLINELAGTNLTGALWLDPWFWLAFAGTLVAATILAGLYPAFVLSSFRPASVLKGAAGSTGSKLWLRRGLVVLQFSASVILICGTVIVYNQLAYMRSMDVGIDMEKVLTVRGPKVLPDDIKYADAMETYLSELRRKPYVREAATSTRTPGRGFNWNGASVRKATDDPASTIRGVVTYMDTSFVSLYRLELAAGNGLREFAAKLSEDAPWPVLANETATRTLGYRTPREALDASIVMGDYQARIVGVLKDFNWSSAHAERQNIFVLHHEGGGFVSLRIASSDYAAAIADIERLHHTLFPGNTFNYAFADEVFDHQYREDRRFAQLFTLFAGLAVFISCLGLFALASFTAQVRTKEIGVRKVLGASVPSVVGLLSREFLKLVGIAFVLAAPLAYLAMNRWLEQFAYRIEIHPTLFVLAGAALLVIALATVSVQAVRAALADPVHALRFE